MKDAVGDLVLNVAEHLCTVVQHVVSTHVRINAVLANRLAMKAEDCVDGLMVKARDVCEMMADAQQVTSTTHGEYMVRLTQFRKSWLREKADGLKKNIAEALVGSKAFDDQPELPPEFVDVVRDAQYEPDKLAVLEICASLHVYTGFLLQGFVEMAAKMVKYNMVEQLGNKLEEKWREELGGSNLHELFPKDEAARRQRKDLQKKVEALEAFKEALSRLKVAIVSTPVRSSTEGVWKEDEASGWKHRADQLKDLVGSAHATEGQGPKARGRCWRV